MHQYGVDNEVRVIRKSGASTAPKTIKTQSQLNQAQRTGAAVTSGRKDAGNSSSGPYDASRMAKVDNDGDIPPAPPKVDLSVGKAIAQARANLGTEGKPFTRKDLAQLVNEKPAVIQEYETGKAIPNQQVLGKLERALKVKLRGENIGEPLTFGKKKK